MITATVVLLFAAWVRSRFRSHAPRMTMAELDAHGLQKWLDAPEKLI